MKYMDDRLPNANSNSCVIVGTRAYYMGYYPSFYLDLTPLSFALRDETLE